jgi:HK97 family phage prohead protease
MKTKSFDARVKAAGEGDGLGDGQFTALVAVFGNEDLGGDVVVPGAFKDSLADWAASGNQIPIIWSHQWSDPFAHIGWCMSAAETPEGLLVTAQLDLANPTGAQVFKLLQQRRVKEFSFGYDVVEGGFVTTDGSEAFELRKLNLIEAGPTLKGMNPETQLLGTKADDEIRRIVREELAAADSGDDPSDTPPDPSDADRSPDAEETESPSKSTGFSYAQIEAWAASQQLLLKEEK